MTLKQLQAKTKTNIRKLKCEIKQQIKCKLLQDYNFNTQSSYLLAIV